MNSKSSLNKQVKLKKNQNSSKQEEQSLKSQASKIQNKLEFLKAQIAMRKTLKNKQKQSEQPATKTGQKYTTSQSWNSSNKGFNPKTTFQNNNPQLNKFLLGNSRQKQQNAQNTQDRQKLQTLLQQLKMEQYRSQICDKYCVEGISRLLELGESDIDQWKSIPVGFRIKLRKFINQHNKNKQQQQKQTKIKQQQQNKNNEDIEEIIKRRKQERVFQPINDKKLEEQQQQQQIPLEILQQQQIYHKNKSKNQKNQSKNENIEDQQDILISSLNSAFLHRKGIIKKQGIDSPQKNTKNKVHWNENVKQYNKQTSKFKGEYLMTKYPHQQKDQEKKQVGMWRERQRQKISYCWFCFKKLTQIKVQQLKQVQDYQNDQQIQQQQDQQHQNQNQQQQHKPKKVLITHQYCNQTCKKGYKKLTSQDPISLQKSKLTTKLVAKNKKRHLVKKKIISEKVNSIKQEVNQQQEEEEDGIQTIDLDLC